VKTYDGGAELNDGACAEGHGEDMGVGRVSVTMGMERGAAGAGASAPIRREVGWRDGVSSSETWP